MPRAEPGSWFFALGMENQSGERYAPSLLQLLREVSEQNNQLCREGCLEPWLENVLRARKMISALNTTLCWSFHLWDKRCSSPSLQSMLEHKPLQTVLVTSVSTDLATQYHCQYLHCTRLTLCYLLLPHSGSDSPAAHQCLPTYIKTSAPQHSAAAQCLAPPGGPMLITHTSLACPYFFRDGISLPWNPFYGLTSAQECTIHSCVPGLTLSANHVCILHAGSTPHLSFTPCTLKPSNSQISLYY